MSTAVVACGALALHVRAIAARRGWDVEVHPLPPELHNRPERIAPAVAELAARYDRVAVAYADCGTGGALDALGFPGCRAPPATTSSRARTSARRSPSSPARTS